MSSEAKPSKKDAWDRLKTLSPLITGVAVALVGGVFTGLYDAREREQRWFENQQAEARLRPEAETAKANQQHQNRILEMEAVERFFPHLTGDNRTRQRAAVITISRLATPELAAELAGLFDSPGAREGAELVNASVSSGSPVSLSATQPLAPAGPSDAERWVYLGEYVVETGSWNKTYLDIGRHETPESLKGRVLKISQTTGALNVRDRPLGEIVGYFKPPTKLHILEIRNFAQLGYMWARVTGQ